ncbi:MAG: BamA/TamA family outer membrane protein [Pseudomonadales bacterium]
MKNQNRKRPLAILVGLNLFFITLVVHLPIRAEQNEERHSVEGLAPDVRGDESRLKYQKGDLVVVPIPTSDPTLGSGLIGAGAYFYSQTEHQKKTQPASMTAAAAMYTNNNSKAGGIAQLNYWDQDAWRFTGVLGYVDLKLEVLTPEDTASGDNVNWNIEGMFSQIRISRRIRGDWYASTGLRYIDFKQTLGETPPGRDISRETVTAGVELGIEFDSRDLPMNPYTGRLFRATALFNDDSLGGDDTYTSYRASLRSYHQFSEPLVLAWEIAGCKKAGDFPLWDACRLPLRGFASTDYLGETGFHAQAEARWRISPRWGLVGFAGVGTIGNSFSREREHEPVPSYGMGIRFMVLKSKRINLRLDYGRSLQSDAVYISVGEAF